jgi:hypothetical protein
LFLPGAMLCHPTPAPVDWAYVRDERPFGGQSKLAALLEGLDWTRVRALRVPPPQAALRSSDTVTQKRSEERHGRSDLIAFRRDNRS